MAKRPFNQAIVDGQDRRPGATPKRQKKDDSSSSKGAAPEPVTSVRQLQGFFAEYSNPSKFQAGIQSFKRFLAECRDLQYALHMNEEVQLCLLQEYLEAQISRDGDETCNDLVQAWSFASQSNNFTLLSSIPTVLHLLLRTISLFPTWKPHGIALIKTVLQPSYLKLIYRSLGGSKDSISSPCLRLLTEINKFDNGSQCHLLHQSLDFTVKDFTRNLDVKKSAKSDTPDVEDPDRPSVRTTFVRFILSFFQYATPNIKTDVMNLRNFTTPLFKHIRQDTAILVNEVLQTFKTGILADQEISRNAKTNYFNEWSLSKLAELCYRDDAINPEKADVTIADISFGFLAETCTITGNGVCFKDNGWYGSTKSDPASTASEKGGKQAVNNRTLLGLIKSLRPYSNTYHLRLLISIFTASPELVAAYFGDNSNGTFSFEPKLTATWIGLSSVMLETIQIKVPETFGFTGSEQPDFPPPVRNIIENILPQQVNRAVLNKCLAYSNGFVRFLAVRILNAAFEKLEAVLNTLETLSKDLVDTSSWDKAIYDLVDEFVRRIPEVGVVITLFNQTLNNGGELQREAVGRLVRNYWEILPSVTAGSATSSTGKGGFDFGPVFAKVFGKIGEVQGIEKLEVEHILRLSKGLVETKWWSKGSEMKYSPAVTLMEVYVEKGNEGGVYKLIEKIIADSPLFGQNNIQEVTGTILSFEALIESLDYMKASKGWERILGYLDNASGRLVQSPYKFYDIVGEAIERTSGNKRTLSPILAVLFHQFKFVKKNEIPKEELESLCKWLLRISNNLWVTGNMAMIETADEDIATSGTEGSNEVFVQFVEGIQAWRQCLTDFGIGRSHKPTDMTGFPMDFGLPAQVASLKPKNVQSIREKYLNPLLSAAMQSSVYALFYWRRMQHIVEILFKIAPANEKILTELEEFSEWESIYQKVAAAYDSAATKVMKSTAYPSAFKDQICLDAMVDKNSQQMYINYFLKSSAQNLFGNLDLALLKVYAKLPIGSLEDEKSIGSQLGDRINKLSNGLKSSKTQTKHFDSLRSTWWRDCETIDRLKSKICTVTQGSGAATDSSDPVWPIIFERLRKEKVVLKGQEIWGATLLFPKDSLWGRFAEHLASRRRGIEDDSTTVDFEILHAMLTERTLAMFSRGLEAIIPFNTDQGMTDLLEATTETLHKDIQKLPSGTRMEDGELRNLSFVVLAFPVVKATSRAYMETDDTTGKFRWKNTLSNEARQQFLKIFYHDSTAHYLIFVDKFSSMNDALGGLSTDFANYFRIGLDFGVIKWDEKLLCLIDANNAGKKALLSPSQFPLFEAAYRVSQGTDMTWFHQRIQRMVYDLTVKLSKAKVGTNGAEILETCELFGQFLNRNEVDLLDYVAKDAVDSLLEAAFEKLEMGGGAVGLALGVIGGVEDAKYLQHSKLLQLVLSASTALSEYPRDPSKTEEQYRLVFIIRKLFYAAKGPHSNITTLDGVLPLYSGSNDPIDAVLLEILISIEGSMGQSIMGRITSVEFDNGGKGKFVERDSKGRLKIIISEKTLKRSIGNFFGRKVSFNDCEDVKGFLEHCKRFGEEEGRTKTYDVGFLAAVIMQAVLAGGRGETRIDVKDVIERGALGVVVTALASENPEERAMAEAVLVAIAGKLEGGKTGEGKSRGYKDRIEVLHLICKILAGIMAFDDGSGLKEKGIPTITAVFLAKMVNIVANPGHWLYEKVMTWLQSRANVDLAEIPLLKEFLRSEAEAYWREVQWGVGSLANGMKGTADVEICRKRGVFEEVLGLYERCAGTGSAGGNKGKEDEVRKKVLELLWNAAGVEGGATTLITRTGVVSWIKVMISMVGDDEEKLTLKRLGARLWEACNKVYVREWSEGNIGRVLEALVML